MKNAIKNRVFQVKTFGTTVFALFALFCTALPLASAQSLSSSPASINSGSLVCASPDHLIQNSFDGTYFTWETGQISDGATIPSANFDAYAASGQLGFFWPNSANGNAGVATTTGATNWRVLQNGDQVGPASVFSQASGAAVNWTSGVNGFLGFKFNCSTAGMCYGFAHITSTGPNGFPARLVHYCFDSEGDAVRIATPTVTKTFTPNAVAVNTDSIATITLSNPAPIAAVLTAPLIDVLPAGLTVSAATTTCSLSLGRFTNDLTLAAVSVTLPAGMTIPANSSCTVDIRVRSAIDGRYVNKIAAGDLKTDQGNNAQRAWAILTVGTPNEIFCSGFELDEDGSCPPPAIVTGTINLPLINNLVGSAFNFTTGDLHPYDAGLVDSINLYNIGSGMRVYWYADVAGIVGVGGVVDSGGTEYAVLQSGDVVGPSRTISSASIPMLNWLGGANGYIGVAFENQSTGVLNYGYIHMTTTGPQGYPAQFLNYGYRNDGGPITIP